MPSDSDIQAGLMEALMTGSMKRNGDGYTLTEKGEAEVEEQLLFYVEAVETLFVMAFTDLSPHLPEEECNILGNVFAAALNQIRFKDIVIKDLIDWKIPND